MNSKMCPPQMMLDNAFELGNDMVEQTAVACDLDVTLDRMKEPQSGVSRVIETLFLSFREHIRDKSIADVESECAQNPCGFGIASSRKRKALKADHGVAAPVRKPVVAGDDGAQFVTGGAGALGTAVVAALSEAGGK